MNNLVSTKWLARHLHDPNLRIIDCRFHLGEPDKGRMEYDEGHLPGAVYFDLEKDLSGPVKEHGGRHPLPDFNTFADKLGYAGVDEGIHVVAYDDQGGAMASRIWWMLKYSGHDRVSVLDGGFSTWSKEGHPVTDESPELTQRQFTWDLRPDMIVDMEEVKKQLGKEHVVIVDSREYERYAGLTEPIDPVAGHIPGAINHFWKDNLSEDGRWKPLEEQAQRFNHLDKKKKVIVHCGSGVTACPNVLTLSELGFEQVQLYLGSWSDWCSYPDNPVEKE